MDTIIQTIELNTADPADIDELRNYFKTLKPSVIIIKDIEKIYIVAVLYHQQEIIEIIEDYMIKYDKWVFDEYRLLTNLYHSLCRKQRKELSADCGFVCTESPLFTNLSYTQIKTLGDPYQNYLNKPYIQKYLAKDQKKSTGCCVVL